MLSINDIMAQATALRREITQLLHNSTYPKYDDLSGLEIDYTDCEQLLLLDELRSVMEKLTDVEDTIRYLDLPIQESGQLWKNTEGRYQLDSGFYYCSGSPIEALVSDDWHEAPYWVRTRVEHDGRDYYLVGHRDVCMDGLTVRIRKRQ